MPYNPINTGDLDKRVTLLAPVYSTESEDEIVDWQPMATIWASLEPIAAQEKGEGMATVGVTGIPVRIRYRRDLDLRYRLQFGQRVLEIAGIVDPLERHEQLELNCKEVT